ncbi:hypothetical protein Pisl_1138 [Pyrobaculum islandicum DSM 4184]|uniref:Ribbon-helix-helix protein CopG domain-containing protein n=1 Tax=Pyrobaculum islandicum (strain DSM 4184 / JCM 9189 / GEO3) TaxID=384616 RepID=A1RTM7_PYRIL|nr:hypothetical protein [Pyrobaculum islandicum]ABL88309.1 hypothetical protein Pisl_1138 [Pyrobaculum islandicum DSM 4184]
MRSARIFVRIPLAMFYELKKVAEELNANISQIVREALKIFLWLFNTKNFSVVKRAIEQNSSLLTYAKSGNSISRGASLYI